jgi:hypothetical protein
MPSKQRGDLGSMNDVLAGQACHIRTGSANEVSLDNGSSGSFPSHCLCD